MRSSWIIWVGPKSDDKCPVRDTQRRGENGHKEDNMKTEAEIRIMQ